MVMRKDEGWDLPTGKPVTRDTIERAIATEKAAAAHEHRATEAWFDASHGALMLMLADGRIFGAPLRMIPSLQSASARQMETLRLSDDGAFVAVKALDVDINVDGLVTRFLEGSPSTVRRLGARLAGSVVSEAKATASARNGRLGGRPRKEKSRRVPEYA